MTDNEKPEVWNRPIGRIDPWDPAWQHGKEVLVDLDRLAPSQPPPEPKRKVDWFAVTLGATLASILLALSFALGYWYRSTLPFCESVTEDSKMVGCDYRDGEWYTETDR